MNGEGYVGGDREGEGDQSGKNFSGPGKKRPNQAEACLPGLKRGTGTGQPKEQSSKRSGKTKCQKKGVPPKICRIKNEKRWGLSPLRRVTHLFA